MANRLANRRNDFAIGMEAATILKRYSNRVFRAYVSDNGDRWYFFWENTAEAVSDLIEALNRAIDEGLPIEFAIECSRFADQCLKDSV